MAGVTIKRLIPFLKKTYNLVDDPCTNELISWNHQNNTFIIWDHNKFTSILLPLHFRHENFSSFVYQLNNYGFRKVNNVPCEYYHQWFQPGRMDLLYNITRRSANPRKKRGKEGATPQAMKKYFEKELEELKGGHKELRTEINKLKQDHEKLQEELVNARAGEEKEESMVDLLMKALLDPSFAQQALEHINRGEVKEGDGETSQKDTHNPQVALEEGLENDNSGKILPNLNSGNFYALEKMINDDMVIEDDSEKGIANGEPKVLLELKELIVDPWHSSQEKVSIEKIDDGSEKECSSMMVLAIAAEDVLKEGV